MNEEIVKLPVPQEFKKEGLLRKLVKFESKGDNDVAMYHVIREDFPFKGNMACRGWEVMDIKYTKKDAEVFGKVIPKGTPLLPSNEQFGHSGWHHVHLDRAEKKFEERLNKPKPKGGRKAKEL